MGEGYVSSPTREIFMSENDKYFNSIVVYPRAHTWQEILRFIAQTMNPDDPYLDFVVSLWSYSIKNNGLTDKQAASIEKFAHSYIDNFNTKVWQAKKNYTGNVVSIDGGKNDNK